ncbi:SBBP repeat-containing protein [Candidatus Zixiibacteriota bacterium]
MYRKWKSTVFLILALTALNGISARADVTDVSWSTFLGGAGSDIGYGITVDGSGNVYVTGQTISSDFPTTSGVVDSVYSGGEAFVTKVNASGTALVYSTFLGGGSIDEGRDIAVDSSGNAFVTGFTWSNDFPTTSGAFDNTHSIQDAFVAKLNPAGDSLAFSTFLGGTLFDLGYGIAVDGQGRVFVTGATNASDFPTTPGALDTIFNEGDQDAFITRLNSTGSALGFSTFLGGSGWDEGRDLELDVSGGIYAVGYSNSLNFPTTPAAYDTMHNGNYDVIIAKLDTAGSSLSFSTYLGGDQDDYGWNLAVDDSGQVHVTGESYSTNFPRSPGAFDTTYNSGEAFVTKLTANGSNLRYSTYLGGDDTDQAYGVSLDISQKAHVTGLTRSATGFPVTVGAYDVTFNGVDDVFLASFNVTGDTLEYGTYLGGSGSDWGESIVLDDFNKIYLTGRTSSSNFPITSGVFDTIANGGDAFVAKLSLAGGDAFPPAEIDDLNIALEENPKVKGLGVRLRWSEPFDDVAIGRYVIYRSTSASSITDSLAGTTDTTYLDIGATGNADSNYNYSIKAVDTSENWSQASNIVGEYDYGLKTTTGTDYTWIAWCLGDTSLKMASDLEAHIEANSSPATNCYTVSEWNATAQTYTNYTTIPIPVGDFPLQPGNAYRVEVATAATWTLVGDVLPSDSIGFNLVTTTGTDYTWISIPLMTTGVDSAADLEAHIEANSSPATNCYTVSEWNATAQTYTNYTTIPIPAGNFMVAAGRPYRVEVSADATWPSSGGMLKDRQAWSGR